MIYKTEIFHSNHDLINFLNTKKIDPSYIVAITHSGIEYTLFYRSYFV